MNGNSDWICMSHLWITDNNSSDIILPPFICNNIPNKYKINKTRENITIINFHRNACHFSRHTNTNINVK